MTAPMAYLPFARRAEAQSFRTARAPSYMECREQPWPPRAQIVSWRQD
jgi:hypothetical protein